MNYKDLKLKAWDSFNGCYYYSKHYKKLSAFFKFIENCIAGGNEITLYQSTNLEDKYRKEIYFDCDIIRVHDYEWSEKHACGYYRRKNDIDFILIDDFPNCTIKLVNPPENFEGFSLQVLFNFKNMYSHLDYPSKMEIVGDIHKM